MVINAYPTMKGRECGSGVSADGVFNFIFLHGAGQLFVKKNIGDK